VSTAADRLKAYALSGASRTAFGERPGLLDELRRRVASVGHPCRPLAEGPMPRNR